MMVLVRDTKTDKAILGHIVLDDALICYTCENREKAIPAGLYSRTTQPRLSAPGRELLREEQTMCGNKDFSLDGVRGIEYI